MRLCAAWRFVQVSMCLVMKILASPYAWVIGPSASLVRIGVSVGRFHSKNGLSIIACECGPHELLVSLQEWAVMCGPNYFLAPNKAVLGGFSPNCPFIPFSAK